MARGTQLTVMIEDLRSEVGHSLQASLGKQTRDVLINTLQRTQKRLWNDYSWPFLSIRRDISTADNQRYYDIPADLVFERIERVEFKWGDQWHKIEYGIGAEEYNQYDSDQGVKSYPVYRYDAYEGNQIEIWPIPNVDTNATTGSGKLRITGTKNLSNFISDSDTADLDDQLIVLYAAAEILARQRQPDAQSKLAQANAHYARLKARSAKSEMFILGGKDLPDRYIPKGPPVVANTTS